MPTDKFKIVNTATNQENPQLKLDTLAPLRRIVSLTVGNERPADLDEFNEDFSMERVSVIEINDTVLWDAMVTATNGNEIQETEEAERINREKFRQAKRNFTNFTERPQYQEWLYGFTRNILRSAVWETLSHNYMFDGKTYHFTVDLPPSPHSQLKLIRKDKEDGLELALEFSSSIYELFDYSQNKTLRLDSQGNLEPVIEGIYGTSQNSIITAQNSIICEVNLRVSLESENLLNPQPQVTIELEVQTHCQKFKYIGGWASEIVQLENIDLPLGDTSPTARYSNSSTYYQEEVGEIITALESANCEIGITIEKITALPTTTVLAGTLLSEMCALSLQLFNEALKISLLKTQYSKNLPNSFSGLSCSLMYLKNLAAQIAPMATANGDPLLIEQAWLELINIFYKLRDERFYKLFIAFEAAPISQLITNASFIYQNFLRFSRSQNLNPLSVKEITHIIFTAISAIKVALKAVQTEKKISIFRASPENTTKTLSNLEDISPVFSHYLRELIINKVSQSPLQDHLLAGLDLPDITTIRLFTASAQPTQEAPTDNAPNAESERHFEVLHVAVPQVTRKLRWCFYSQTPEKIAALLERNPAVKGFNDGSAIYFTVQQLLSVYPDERIKALPYLTFVNIGAGIIGMGIGRYAVLHPKLPMNTFIRLWEAATDGLMVCTFNMGTAIDIYLAIYFPNNSNKPILVSDAVFWKEIASGPISLAVAYIIWRSMPPVVTQRYFNKNLKQALEIAAKFLFYGGVFESLLINLQTEVYLSYKSILAATIVPAALLSLVHLTRFKERLNVGMIYLSTLYFAYKLTKELSSKEIAPELIYTQMGFWTISLIASLYFTIAHSIEFIKEYKGPVEIVVRPLPTADLGEPLSPISVRSNSGVNLATISSQEYHAIQRAEQETSTDRTPLITFAKQLHDRQYQTTVSSMQDPSEEITAKPKWWQRFSVTRLTATQ